MSTETLVQAITAGQTAIFGAGSAFLIQDAPGTLKIVARRLGKSDENTVLTGVESGFTYRAPVGREFDRLEVTGDTSGNLTIVLGDGDVKFADAVSIVGSVATAIKPASTLSDTAPVVTAAGTAALFAANAGRKRMTVFSDPGNAGDTAIYFRKTGGANKLGFVVPGESIEIDGIYGVDYDCTNGGDTIYLFEES